MTNNKVTPIEIANSAAQQIGDTVLQEYSEHTSGSNNSAFGWYCDDVVIHRAFWAGRGKVEYVATVFALGTYDLDKPMFGSDRFTVKIQGQLEDLNQNYEFMAGSFEVLDFEEPNFED